LSSGELRGQARVVNVVDEGTAWRISFALVGPSSAEAERMETEVLDTALQHFEFFASRTEGR